MNIRASELLSRRKLLAGLALGAGALGAVAAPTLNRTWFKRDDRDGASRGNARLASLDRAHFEEWSRHVGTEFQVHGEAGVARVRLISVEPLPSKGLRPAGVARKQAFLAKFAGSSALPAGNRIYSVLHGTGAMKIFLTAIDPGSATARLEAVFN